MDGMPVGSSVMVQQPAPADERTVVQTEILKRLQQEQRERAGTGLAHGAEYTYCCERCTKVFRDTIKNSSWQRTSYEYEMMRKALMIYDHAYQPVFCDACYQDVIVPNTSLGRTMGYPNLVLEKFGVADQAG